MNCEALKRLKKNLHFIKENYFVYFCDQPTHVRNCDSYFSDDTEIEKYCRYATVQFGETKESRFSFKRKEKETEKKQKILITLIENFDNNTELCFKVNEYDTTFIYCLIMCH